MIHCHYTKETIDKITTRRRWTIGCCGFLSMGLAWLFVEIVIHNPVIPPFPVIGCFCLFFWTMWCLCNAEKTTLTHATDGITLDDDKIRLIKVNGTQISLPRNGLKIRSPYGITGRIGSMIFRIENPEVSKDAIVLTSYMENAKKLVETIQPGAWDAGDRWTIWEFKG